MAVTQCEQGHYYDDGKFAECPHCKNPLPQKPARGIGEAHTVFRPSDDSVARRAAGRPQMRVEFAQPGGPQDEKTVGIFRAKHGCDPVVGWLVCTGGAEKGRDYRLHAGRNLIGRAVTMDIALVDDATITREDHCSIVYEPNQSKFVIVRGKGDGVLVDKQRVHESLELFGNEEIEIGTSTFVFVPFCTGGRTW